MPALTFAVLATLLVQTQAWSVQTRGQFPLPHAATASLAPTPDGQAKSIYVTTFAAVEADASYVLPNFASNFNASHLRTIDTTVVWPNEAQAAPFNTSVVTLAGGFFANPTKATGRVSVLGVDAATGSVGALAQVSQDKTAYFYHHVEWTPIDSRLNGLVSARVKVPTVGQADGQLVLFTPSSNDYVHTSWRETVLASGPDVFFTLADLEGKGNMVVLAAQFFTSKALMVYDCQGALVNCSADSVKSYVVDNSEAAGFFDVTYADINNDGQPDILATTNTATGKGGVFVYQRNGDYRQGPVAWTKHELATGYKPTLPFLPGRGAPGSVSIFQPQHDGGSSKPWVLVSGDDAGTVSVLVPASPNSSDWQYTQTFIYNTTGTVGSPVAIPPGAGSSALMDVVVPDYAQGKMVWLSLIQ